MVNDTIFEPSFGNRPSSVVGRADVLRQFDLGLDSRPGSRERAMLLLGQRGCGKTVLLWELADRAREAGFVVANPVISGGDMLARIVEKAQDDAEKYLRPARGKVTGGSVGAFGFSAGLQFSREDSGESFQRRLSRLCGALTERGHGLLVLVDEVQANLPEMRQLVSAYQEIVGERLDIALAMAGLPGAVSSTLNNRVLTFLNRARKIELGPLPAREVEAYFRTSFAQLGLSVPDSLCEQAARAAAPSPYLMQLIGHGVVLFAHEDGSVDDGVLCKALASAREDFEGDVCKTTLAALSERDVAFLRAMAQDAGESSVADIAARMGVSDDYARKYRTRLVDAGVVQKTRRSHVAFAVPHLADYLRDSGD